jgi:hypothetical protein
MKNVINPLLTSNGEFPLLLCHMSNIVRHVMAVSIRYKHYQDQVNTTFFHECCHLMTECKFFMKMLPISMKPLFFKNY